LIDLLVSIAIVAVLFGGIYLIYFSLVTSITNISVRTAATAAIQAHLETIRNLPYDSVGTAGGIPSGVIPQNRSMIVNGYTFSLNTTVRNIDDPFDGTLNGNPPPVDTAPADYKLVQVTATCVQCANFVAVTMTTTVAPKALEGATQNGSIFIYVLDASGRGVSLANVQVVNSSVTPSINLTDTTNASGVLQLVGVPTSTQGYQITVTKPGYSSDQTYPPGGAGNPNPVKPNITAAAQTVSSVTFGIDRVSGLTVSSVDNRCNAIPNESFSIKGTKLIGTSPDILKFSTTSATNASGSVFLANMEWDTYPITLNDATRNLAGTVPLTPLTINPSTTPTFQFVVAPLANPSLLVTLLDSASGAGIANATITASTSGFSKTLVGGHATITDADWSGGQYTSQSGTNPNTPGRITLATNASGTYTTSTSAWLISKTIDFGSVSSTFYNVSWMPATQPSQTGANSLKFQVATNNDNTTWNFIGPDGTASTFFTASSSLPATLSNNRYLRYKVYMTTQNGSFTPELDTITFEFSGPCVPQMQALFTSLPQGSYSIAASAANYRSGSTTVSVASGAQTSTISLTHL
jgi:hypothetical protein